MENGKRAKIGDARALQQFLHVIIISLFASTVDNRDDYEENQRVRTNNLN